VASIKAGADQHAANVMPIIKKAQKAGATTLLGAQRQRHIDGMGRGLARNVSEERAGPLSSAQVPLGRTLMLTAGVWLIGTGMVALSLESFNACSLSSLQR
jgi:hypothetical protein